MTKLLTMKIKVGSNCTSVMENDGERNRVMTLSGRIAGKTKPCFQTFVTESDAWACRVNQAIVNKVSIILNNH